MSSRSFNQILAVVAVLAVSPALAAELSPEAINSAEPSKKSLSKDKATPAGVRLQVLLDRAHFSPGEIDGNFGENARKALRAYAEARQLPSGDGPTEEVWNALRTDDGPAIQTIPSLRNRTLQHHIAGGLEQIGPAAASLGVVWVQLFELSPCQRRGFLDGLLPREGGGTHPA